MRFFRIASLFLGAAAIAGVGRGFGQESPPPDSYLDARAAELVANARSGGVSANDEIDAYEMVAKQRVSLGLEARRRERLIFRREIASRVTWTRENGRRSEILGARQVVPIALPGVMALDSADFANGEADLAINPSGGWLLRVPFESLADQDSEATDRQVDDADDDGPRDDDEGDLIHPLSPGSEAHYRFRTGSTTAIRLADGQEIRLVELQVLPRRAVPQLLSGSFWLDESTNAPVRGVFGLAAPFTMDIDLGGGLLSFGVGSATIRYLTMEYGFWENRWWLPRLISFEGVASLRSLSMPVVLEQRFEDYRIHTAVNPWPGFPEPDTLRFQLFERRCAEDAEDCLPRITLVPRDTALLVESPDLPASIYDGGRWLVSDRELAEVADLLEASRWRGFGSSAPRRYWHPIEGRIVHYNRVEGLTIGTGAGIELAPLSASAAVWVGTADVSPGFDATLVRSRLRGSESIGVYRRTEAFAPEDDPFSIGNSLSAFLFGADDGDYFRVLGANLTTEHDLSMSSSVQMRGYAERHSPMEKATDVSVAYWMDDRLFRENPAADPADQLGVEATIDFHHGLDPHGFRFSAEAGIRAELGTFEFARPIIALQSTFPLPGRYVGALEVTTGTSFGILPVQRLWHVGGPGSVRGFRPAERIVGESFWTARGEVGTDRPGARVVLFADAGWAGERSTFTTDPALVSTGVGVSFLDGLVRADLARVLRGGPERWRFQLHLDAPL